MILDQLCNLEALLGRAARDRLLALGVTHGEAGRAALADAYADPARLRHEAHRLRGAVAPFGAGVLAALLLRVEMGEAVPAAATDDAIAAFVAACRAALKAPC